MEPISGRESHIERTATEPRDSHKHAVTLSRIDQINGNVRLFRLEIQKGSSIKFLPGQWLDTYVPNVTKPGGFTITSPPSKARLPGSPYLELAVQRSPSNPAAAWLWDKSFIGATLNIRVGGSFVWPPQELDLASLRRVVFVAGGVGVNPLISIVSHLAEDKCPYDIQFLYSAKAPKNIDKEKPLFIERLAAIYGREKVHGRLQLFLTGHNVANETVLSCNNVDVPFKPRRMTLADVTEALGHKEDHNAAVVYVCGVPSMTDEFVGRLVSPDELGLDRGQVLCEKWW